MRIAALLAATAAATIATAAGAATPSVGDGFIPVGADTQAPRGFVDMCHRDATFCAAGPIESAPIVTAAIADPWSPWTLFRAAPVSALPATISVRFALPAPSAVPPAISAAAIAPREERALLERIDREVNGHVAQVTDERRYGRDEYWVRSGTGHGAAGDCEDIAIEKRYELVAAGFPADRLAFAVVYMPRIGLHTVLVARTDEGDMVLDSRTPYVTRWDRTRYSWITVQSMGDPMRWHGVHRPTTLQLVAAPSADRQAG